MKAARKQTLVIRDATQLRSLRTPLRQRVVAAMSRLEACTIKELAQEVGRAPASLYYHVHELVRAGIVREIGRRPSRRRAEAVYGLVGKRLLIDRKRRSAAFLAALADAHRATMRAAERELVRSLRLERRGGRDRGGAAVLLRLSSRLRPRQAAQTRRMLQDLARFVAENNAPDAPDAYTVTALLVRLPGPRARRQERRRARAVSRALTTGTR